jgi:hypothetical protein
VDDIHPIPQSIADILYGDVDNVRFAHIGVEVEAIQFGVGEKSAYADGGLLFGVQPSKRAFQLRFGCDVDLQHDVRLLARCVRLKRHRVLVTILGPFRDSKADTLPGVAGCHGDDGDYGPLEVVDRSFGGKAQVNVIGRRTAEITRDEPSKECRVKGERDIEDDVREAHLLHRLQKRMIRIHGVRSFRNALFGFIEQGVCLFKVA